MANEERGEVRLEVDGTNYILKLDLTHIAAVQRLSHRPLGQLLKAIEDLDVEAMAALLWAGLQTNHAKHFKHIDTVLALMEKAGGVDALGNFVVTIAALVTRKTPDAQAADPLTAQSGGTVPSSTLEPELTPA